MADDNLTRMGNQIATFFDSMPDRQEALLDLATHLKKFWEPRMRHDFLARIVGERDGCTVLVGQGEGGSGVAGGQARGFSHPSTLPAVAGVGRR